MSLASYALLAVGTAMLCLVGIGVAVLEVVSP